jgi:hypothetical protein
MTIAAARNTNAAGGGYRAPQQPGHRRGDQVAAGLDRGQQPERRPPQPLRCQAGHSGALRGLATPNPQPGQHERRQQQHRISWPGREQHRPERQHPHWAAPVPVPPGRHADRRGRHVVPHIQQHPQLRLGGPAVPGREQVRGPQDQQRGRAVPGLEHRPAEPPHPALIPAICRPARTPANQPESHPADHGLHRPGAKRPGSGLRALRRQREPPAQTPRPCGRAQVAQL